MTVDDFIDWADETAARLPALDYSEPLKDSAELISQAIDENFAGARDPDGNPWPPLEQPRRSGGTGPPLDDTGLLSSSSKVEELTANELVFGDPVEYAAFQNSGTGTIPARQFMGVNGETVDEVLVIFVTWLDGELK